MPLQLETPLSSGDLDKSAPNSLYAQAKICSFRIDINNKALYVDLEYGNTVDGEWRRGILPTRTITILNTQIITTDPETGVVLSLNEDPQYDEIVSIPPDTLEFSLYQQVAIVLYQWLIDKEMISGTIV